MSKPKGIREIWCLLFCPFADRDGLFYLDINRYIDAKDKSYDDINERKELERAADMLFGNSK